MSDATPIGLETYPMQEVEPSPPAVQPDRPEANRLLSLDAYRGFVMLAMASAGLGLPAVATHFNESRAWRVVASQVEHVAWVGCSAWDLIQPSFMFIVGVAMPWAYANRRSKGQGWWGQFGHALTRALTLILLGVFLSSNGSKQTNWTFVNVLTQIGLGYPFVFLILGWKPRWQFVAAVAVLVGYWSFFAYWPLPGAGGSWPLTPQFDTLLSHWTKNANAASDIDARWLNVLPYPDGSGFRPNDGGYATLNFIPSIATAIFGVLAGRLLKSGRSTGAKLLTFVILGAVGIGVGMALDQTICPVVKRIWTPSWVLVSTGWASLMLAAFVTLVDVWNLRRLAFPLVVVGSNSIVMYVMAQLIKPWVRQSLRIHLTTLTYVFDHWLGFGPSLVPKVQGAGPLFAGTFGPIYEASAVLFVLWLVCLWLYRRELFVKI